MIAKPLGLDVEGVKANFFSAYQEEGAQWQAITGAPIASTQETETYSFLDEISAFDYWDKSGAIPEAQANLGTYTLKNRPFGLNWTVSEHEVRLDKTNQIMMRARQMGSGAAHWYNDQLATLIEAGTSGTAFDGVAFFSNASGIVRPYDNYGTGALGQIALETAVAEMRSFVGRSGKRLGVRPTHLVVPPELEFTAKRILLTNQEGPTLTRSEADVFAGRLQLIVLDSLTAAAPWYLMDLSKPIRPFFMQELLPLRVMDNQGNLTDSYMQSRTYKFSADGECAFGYSLPFLCYKSTGA